MSDAAAPAVQVLSDDDLTTRSDNGNDRMRWTWLDPNDSSIVWGIGQISMMAVEMAPAATPLWHPKPVPKPGSITPPAAQVWQNRFYFDVGDPFPYIQVSDFGILPSEKSGLESGAWFLSVSTGLVGIDAHVFNPVTNASIAIVKDEPMDKACTDLQAYPDGSAVTFVPTSPGHEA